MPEIRQNIAIIYGLRLSAKASMMEKIPNPIHENEEMLLRELGGDTPDLVFIMGMHRSGTTLLYQLLDASDRVDVLRAYHLIESHRLLVNCQMGEEEARKARINERLRAAGMETRNLDRVAVGADLPEEYGFALGENGRTTLSTDNLQTLTDLCRKIVHINDSGRPLLLKNPWDSTNFALIASALPRARFLFLHRHPIDVINSQIRAARTLYGRRSEYHAMLDAGYDQIWEQPLRLWLVRSLFSSRLSIGFRIAMRSVVKATDYFQKHIDTLDSDRYILLRFEDLCSEPNREVGRILRFLNLPPLAVDLAPLIQKREPDLLPEVRAKRSVVEQRLNQYMTSQGYE